jgi:integrase
MLAFARCRSSHQSTTHFVISPREQLNAVAMPRTNWSSRPSTGRRYTSRTSTAALERAGLADAGYRFHDLRHTCVSRLVAAGADVKLVQAVAGHSNPLITLKRYAHLRDARVGEAADRFDPARVP